jgi:DNA polymerase I-like protein with 3'-5' exonuclease and polymerase domains
LQVVVWEADDVELRQALREGADIHSINAKNLGCSRDMAKRYCHGINYGGSYRTMARNCGLTNHQSETMQKRWFQAHPGIKTWHARTMNQLMATRTVTNKFGYSRIYFERVEGLLPEALAWVPQSTVAIVITKTILRVEETLYPAVETMLQVHDSLVLQTPVSNFPACVPQIKEAFQVTIPYPKPLVIPASGKWSTKSWGDAKDIRLEELIAPLISN